MNGEPTSVGDAVGDGVGLLDRRLAAMIVGDLEPDRAVARRERTLAGHRGRLEPALVVGVGGEVAELGPQAPGLGEEEAAVGRDRHVLAEQVLQHRQARVLGVRALRHLRQLVRVAEQHERAGARAGGKHVGERQLAGLVDEQHVDRPLRRVQVDGRRVSDQPVPATRSKEGSAAATVSTDETMQRLVKAVSGQSSARARLTPLKVKSCASASCWIARRRLWIALWLSEVTPTRLPSRISAIAIRAPCQVLPEPGGPCTNR